MTLFQDISQIYALLKEIRVKNRNNPWINDEITRAQHTRDYLHRKATSSKNPQLFDEYRTMRNPVNYMIIDAQQKYYQQELRNAKNNTKKCGIHLNISLIKRKPILFLPTSLLINSTSTSLK